MKKAEIGTALMIVALVVMSIIGFASSSILSSKKTNLASNSRATYSGCEPDTNKEEVGTPIHKCSKTSLPSNNWNYCVGGSINYVLPDDQHICNQNNYYADNLTRECYTQECCDESTAGDLGYTYNGNTCGKDGNGGQPGDGTTNPAMVAEGPSSSGRDSRCSAYSAGYNNACCVQDTHYCEGKGNIRYRWYGCTGAPCDETIISTQGGPGNLINCPDGVDSSTNPETGKCKDELPTPTSTPAPASQAQKPYDDNGKIARNGPWCCPPDVIPPAPTNTCLAANKNNNNNDIYKCISNIQIDNQGNLDANKSCRIGFPDSTYISSLSCGATASYQVCCKRSATSGSIVIPTAETTPGEDYYVAPTIIPTDKLNYIEDINSQNICIAKNFSFDEQNFENNINGQAVPCGTNYILYSNNNNLVIRACNPKGSTYRCNYRCIKDNLEKNCWDRQVTVNHMWITNHNTKSTNSIYIGLLRVWDVKKVVEKKDLINIPSDGFYTYDLGEMTDVCDKWSVGMNYFSYLLFYKNNITDEYTQSSGDEVFPCRVDGNYLIIIK